MNSIVPCDLQNLVKLLNLENDNSSDEDESRLSFRDNPSSIAHQNNQCASKEYTDKYAKFETSKNIWSEEEVLDIEYDESLSKQEPKYELVYRQNVTADDVYLQLSNKNPGSNSCESMALKIELRDTASIEEILLKITTHSVLCKTQKYHLNLELPKTVDPERCSAKWDRSSCILTVVMFSEDESNINI